MTKAEQARQVAWRLKIFFDYDSATTIHAP
jgi:hypothetical protein